MLQNLDPIAEGIRTTLEAKHAAREAALSSSRVLTRHCANAIRAMHRQEWQTAQELLDTARGVLTAMHHGVEAYPDLYYAGYTQDSFKEYVEARLTFALVRNEPLPSVQEISVEEATYLNGLCEAASELRRY